MNPSTVENLTDLTALPTIFSLLVIDITMVYVAIMMNNLEYRVKQEHEMQSYSAKKSFHKDREMMSYLQSHDEQG